MIQIQQLSQEELKLLPANAQLLYDFYIHEIKEKTKWANKTPITVLAGKTARKSSVPN